MPDVYKDFDVDVNPDEDSVTISLLVYTNPSNNETSRFVNLKEERAPEDYRMAYNSVLKETLWMVSLQTVSNLLLLVPLLVTGDIEFVLKSIDTNSSSASKVKERHSALVLNIGTFAEEDEAYELLNSLSMYLPVVVMVFWVFDALLAAVYLKMFHPWKIILQEVSSLGFVFRL